ncbi:hypothetical protein IFM89_009661 [Coptis chinensis]|uniref:RRM domain-containing protein n=1 Tax=Coptis chinensis TaxID=261450 RepID=A0A835IMC3_9MAGN|nr:hypothetical protein IFM89_009661 [Coptis chinensis]
MFIFQLLAGLEHAIAGTNGKTEAIARFFNDLLRDPSESGVVVDVYINEEKNFAIVEFKSPRDAIEAVREDGIVFEDATLNIRWPTDYNPTLILDLDPKQKSCPWLKYGLRGGLYANATQSRWVFGCILRDSLGGFIFGIAAPISYATSIFAEFYALRLGVLAFSELQMENIVIEVDSKYLHELLTKRCDQEVPHSIKILYDDICEGLSKIRNKRIEWNYREANKTADCLANYASNLVNHLNWSTAQDHLITQPAEFANVLPPESLYWWKIPPPFLGHVLNLDVQGHGTDRLVPSYQ